MVLRNGTVYAPDALPSPLVQQADAANSAIVRGVDFSGDWRGSLQLTATHLGTGGGSAGNYRLVIDPDLAHGTYYGAQGFPHSIAITRDADSIIIRNLDSNSILKMKVAADGASATVHSRVDPGDGRWAESEGVFYRR